MSLSVATSKSLFDKMAYELEQYVFTIKDLICTYEYM